MAIWAWIAPAPETVNLFMLQASTYPDLFRSLREHYALSQPSLPELWSKTSGDHKLYGEGSKHRKYVRLHVSIWSRQDVAAMLHCSALVQYGHLKPRGLEWLSRQIASGWCGSWGWLLFRSTIWKQRIPSYVAYTLRSHEGLVASAWTALRLCT